jgi:hypothetical protein
VLRDTRASLDEVLEKLADLDAQLSDLVSRCEASLVTKPVGDVEASLPEPDELGDDSGPSRLC